MPDLFLLNLKEPAGAALLARVRDQTSPQFAALARRFERVFLLGAPSAPAFRCLGAEIALEGEAAQAYGAARLSVTGNGETLEQALTSCLGEAVDRLAQVGRPGDVRDGMADDLTRIADGWIAQVLEPAAHGIDWMEARDAARGGAVALPADVCVRRPPSQRTMRPAGAPSTGVAAGPSFPAAAMRATLELCERDAAALWWIGGQRPRAFAPGHAATVTGSRLLNALRQDRSDRVTQVLDITTDLEIPTIAAVSFDRDGYGLACGLAARLDWGDAARAAILEMCQMELAAPLTEAKRRERGDAALNEIDRRHLQRETFAASACDLLHPRGLSTLQPSGSPADQDVGALAARLEGRGVRLFVVDLTRPDLGIAAARMVSPELQPYSADVVTERLRRCRSINGVIDTEAARISLV